MADFRHTSDNQWINTLDDFWFGVLTAVGAGGGWDEDFIYLRRRWRTHKMQANVSLPVRITATAAVMNAPGYLYGILIQPDGTNNVSVTLRDHASAGSGTYLSPTIVVAGNGGPRVLFFPDVWCKAGIHATVAVAGGGACDAVIYCKKR